MVLIFVILIVNTALWIPAVCAAIFWSNWLWLIVGWLIIGMAALRMYLNTWVDTPPIWFWPIIVVFWPAVFTGGIIHPLR